MKGVILSLTIAGLMAASSGCRRCHINLQHCGPCGVGMGCGEWYFGDWHDGCEPCDRHGHWTGECCEGYGGDVIYEEPHYGGPIHAEWPVLDNYDYVDGPYYEEMPADGYSRSARGRSRHAPVWPQQATSGGRSLHAAQFRGSRWAR